VALSFVIHEMLPIISNYSSIFCPMRSVVMTLSLFLSTLPMDSYGHANRDRIPALSFLTCTHESHHKNVRGLQWKRLRRLWRHRHDHHCGGLIVHPPVLPPGVVARTFTYRNGRTETIYTALFPAEGPIKVTDASGQAAWVFMYAHFVFAWLDGAAHVTIAHGSIAGNRISVWRDVAIEGRWSAQALSEFGRRWVREQFRR
jgi:hypothetical protein